MAIKKGRGRGLGALIHENTPAEAPPAESPKTESVRKVPIDAISRSEWQPRKTFEADALEELAESIRERGILQPLLVRPAGEGYQLIAGERRLRAAREAGLTDVPVIVMSATDSDAMQLAMIENLQRENLNVIEEAEGYRVLTDTFAMTQEDIAARVGRARASVANALRLLSLPEEVRHLTAAGDLSAGHAKLLTGLNDAGQQVMLARRTVAEGLSVRALENLIRRARQIPRRPRISRADIPADHLNQLGDRLHAHFGTSVRIFPSRTYANGRKGRGAIEIDYYSNEDLDRILHLLGIEAD